MQRPQSQHILFEPQNPDYRRAVQDAFNNQPLLSHLGAELHAIEPGYCEIVMPAAAHLLQHHGYFHGGAIATLADVSGGFSGWTLLPEKKAMLTVEYKTNILSPGRGDALLGRGWVVKAGRTLTVTNIEIYSRIEGELSLCATALQTLMAVDI